MLQISLIAIYFQEYWKFDMSLERSNMLSHNDINPVFKEIIYGSPLVAISESSYLW